MVHRPELPPKVIQERLGHASISMTFDRYGHLFPKAEDADEIAAAELAVMLVNGNMMAT